MKLNVVYFDVFVSHEGIRLTKSLSQ